MALAFLRASSRSIVEPQGVEGERLRQVAGDPEFAQTRGLTDIALATTTGGRPAAAKASLRRTAHPVSPGRLMSSRTSDGRRPPSSAATVASVDAGDHDRVPVGTEVSGEQVAEGLVVLHEEDRSRRAIRRHACARRHRRRTRTSMPSSSVRQSGSSSTPSSAAIGRTIAIAASLRRRPPTVVRRAPPDATRWTALPRSSASRSMVALTWSVSIHELHRRPGPKRRTAADRNRSRTTQGPLEAVAVVSRRRPGTRRRARRRSGRAASRSGPPPRACGGSG